MNFAKDSLLFHSPIPRAQARVAAQRRSHLWTDLEEVACVLAGYMVLCAMLVFAALHA